MKFSILLKTIIYEEEMLNVLFSPEKVREISEAHVLVKWFICLDGFLNFHSLEA
jgi:hypothetical protein